MSAAILTRPSYSVKSPHEVVVFFMCADPEPDNELAIATRKRSIMISDPHRPDVNAERLELHRRVKRIPLPEPEFISRETLDVRR